MTSTFDALSCRLKRRYMTPQQRLETIKRVRTNRLKRLSKQDNKNVGDFSNMKSSTKDESHNSEINKYMNLEEKR